MVTGGTREGTFYTPTVLTDVRADMPLMREEIFGPVAVVTPFDELDAYDLNRFSLEAAEAPAAQEQTMETRASVQPKTETECIKFTASVFQIMILGSSRCSLVQWAGQKSSENLWQGRRATRSGPASRTWNAA